MKDHVFGFPDENATGDDMIMVNRRDYDFLRQESALHESLKKDHAALKIVCDTTLKSANKMEDAYIGLVKRVRAQSWWQRIFFSPLFPEERRINYE